MNPSLVSEPVETTHSIDVEQPSFFTNYALILSLLAQSPDLRVRDLSIQTGLTERGIQRIIDVLSASGYLHISKNGKRNHYELKKEMPIWELRNSEKKTVQDLVSFISG